jgi:predicted nucleic acid-binding protein
MGAHAREVEWPSAEGGANDLWVAACCIVHDVPLAINNLGDFKLIAENFPLRLIHPDL